MIGRRSLAAGLSLLLLAACGEPETRTMRVRVQDADGTPIAGAELLYLSELREEPYGGIAVPPLGAARMLAVGRATSDRDGVASLEVGSDRRGGLLVLADGHLPGGFLVADELRRDGKVDVLALRDGGRELARAVAPGPGEAERVTVPGLLLSSWVHNKATTDFGHDLRLYAEEVDPGLYEFPALAALPTPWIDGQVRDIATLHTPGYSATGAVRGDDGVFLVELGAAPRMLNLSYRGGPDLPSSLLVEIQAVVDVPEDALPALAPEDPPVWCAFGAPLAAGAESVRAVAVWEDTASLVFFVHLGEAGSHRFVLPVEALGFGRQADALDLTESVRAALPASE